MRDRPGAWDVCHPDPVNVAQTLALVVPAVQDFKRRAMTRPDGEHTMSPALIALRDDRVLVVVTAPRPAIVLACAPTLAVGLAAQALVFAAQASLPERALTEEQEAQPAGPALAYTTMSREREAAMAVQRFEVGADGELLFGRPTKGRPSNRSVMDALAAAMSHEPLNPATVVDKQQSQEQDSKVYLPAERGRHVLDSSTATAVHGKVKGVAGTVLFLAGSGAHATGLLAHGMPQDLLLGHGATR